MRATIITTLNHNVGDDFVREGIVYLLRQALPGVAVEVSNIHKHSPITVRYGFEHRRAGRTSRRLDRWMPKWVTRDRIKEADLLIQSGAPVYWCHPTSHCADNEWFGPLIRKRYLAYGAKVPFLNLAAGTAQSYFSDGNEFARCPKDTAYIQEFHGMCAVTTVRDRLAKHVLNTLGLDAPLIPCSSIFATKELGVEPQAGEYIALNYMEGGGHYDWDRNLDSARWEQTFRDYYRDLVARGEKVLFICHNQAEVKAAKKIDPEAPIFTSPHHQDFFPAYAKAKFGILNRVHGGFALASLGKPSFIIGTDSRARMPEEIGLRHAYANDVDVDRLKAEEAHLRATLDTFPATFEAIRTRAFQDYMKVLAPVLERYRVPTA